MALPSRPNARLNGLPSGPGPRSRSQTRAANVPRESSRTRSDPGDAPSRPLRPQKSLTNLREERRGRWERDTPPVPALPTHVSRMRTKGDRRGSDDSTTSSSSALSRGSGRSGYSTPATEIEEGYEREDKFEEGEEEEEEEEKSVPRGFGYSLWSKIQTAATNLSVNVGKSWETNVSLSSGEVTPPGQESRITRALKAYHIAKASRPSDLPAWLFDEKERGLTSRLAASGRQSPDDPRNITGDTYDARDEPAPPPKPMVAPVANRRPEYKKVYADEEDRQSMSRATQRLKQLRDAKALPRKQTIREDSGVQHMSPLAPAEPVNAREMGPAKRDVSAKRPVARGLPSGVRPMGRM
ncbi:hypothetical protein BDY19DRAFT_263307 [Irpex rosettiformis]|uniref:Uncharacterized protein n=1 Tax=Irpex rosettiformis TaxID=378272 RepID=A0ACB8UGR9_9APHY|nr:hypothetical protein BDY19DRAFT_263307 [Irpex rosettiformis]